MNIFIAFNYENQPLGLILAENKDFAEVAFTALSINHHSIEEIDKDIDLGSKVYYLLTSQQVPESSRLRRWIRGK